MRIAIVVALIASELFGGSLPCQEVSGSLSGRVTTAAGEPALSATATISGRDLLGSRTTTTDRGGYFQVLALPPGTYRVQIARLGFRPVVLESVVVQLGRATSLPPVVLQESTIELEVVRVVAAEQSIEATSTDVGGTLDESDYGALPGDRDYKSMISTLPHANESDRGDPINVAGASGLENIYYVDGVNVTAPLKAETGTSLPYNFVRVIEVKTGGYQAQYGNALGGLVNAVTHSGTNDFELTTFVFGTHGGLRARPREEPTLRETSAVSYDAGVRVSGPLRRDRLWYSAAYNPRVDRTDREVQGHGEFTDKESVQTFAVKLTWQAGEGTEVGLSAFGDPSTRHAVAIPGGVISGLTPLDPNAYLSRLERGGFVRSLRATRRFGGRGLLEASLSRFEGRQHIEGDTQIARTTPLLIDLFSLTTSGGIRFFQHSSLRRSSAVLRGTLTTGPHTIVLGGEFEDLASARTFRTNAGFEIERDALGNYSTFTEGGAGEFHNRMPVAYLQDSWRLTDRITLNAGIRWSSQNLSNATGNTVQRFANEWQPRFGAIWQLGKSSNQVVFVSWGRIYQQLPLNLSSLFYLDYAAVLSFYSTDPRQPGAVVDSVFDFSSREADVRHHIRGLQAEHLDEATIGYRVLVGKGSKVTARFIRRDLRSSFQWGFGPQGIVLGTPGKGDFAFLPKPIRRYSALEFTAVGEQHGVKYRSSYVMSRNWGNYTGFFGSDLGFPNPGGNAAFIAPHQAVNSEGLLPNDRTHVLKFSGARSLPRNLTTGLTFTWQSGSPLNEFAPSPVAGLAIQRAFVVRRGSAGRTPSLWDVSARLAYAVGAAERLNSRILLDVLHLGNPQRVVWVEELKYLVNNAGAFANLNPRYGEPIAFQRPMMARLGWETDF